MFEEAKSRGFEVLAVHHAEAILKHDMPDAISDLESVLLDMRIGVEELVRGGGGEGAFTQRTRRRLVDAGWVKHRFEITTTVDGEARESVSHEVDHVKRFAKGSVALEIEWNNKDPFFDRDLENFKRLHTDAAISVGCVVTRGSTLQEILRESVEEFAKQKGIRNFDAVEGYYRPTSRQRDLITRLAEARGSFERGWAEAFVQDKFGEATTHWRKLEDRVRRGVGNPCPLLLIGVPRSVLSF